MENNNIVLIVLVGMPCSGKSTWTKNMEFSFKLKYGSYPIVISRDNIREELFGKNYKYTQKNEEKVVETYYKYLSKAILIDNSVIILDNTHIRKSYIDVYNVMFGSLCKTGNMKMYIKFFDISLIKALWRNFWRGWHTGKKIPLKTMINYYKAYKKLDQSKYSHLKLENI